MFLLFNVIFFENIGMFEVLVLKRKSRSQDVGRLCVEDIFDDNRLEDSLELDFDFSSLEIKIIRVFRLLRNLEILLFFIR